MRNEKIVLETPESLDDGGKSLSLIWLSGMVLGVVSGILFGVVASVNGNGTLERIIMYPLFFGGIGLLIGWGIKNKIVKWKTLYLRKIRFMVDEKLWYPILFQKLANIFDDMNVRLQMYNENNTSITICLDDVQYDIVFNDDDTFSIYWSQNFFKSFMRQGYYISLYKKLVKGMGVIGYCVQQACRVEQYHVPVTSVKWKM